jgi:hypothetical protein
MCDNGDVTRIISIDRAEAAFFGANRRLFFRVMFDDKTRVATLRGRAQWTRSHRSLTTCEFL